MGDETPKASRSPRRRLETPSPDPRRPLHPEEEEEEEENGRQWQEPASPDNGHRDEAALSLLCHLCLLCYYIYVHCYDASVEKGEYFDQAVEGFGGRWKFITHIDLSILLLYFLFSFIVDLITQWTPLPLLRDSRDLVFTTIALPLSMFITVGFWSLFAIDRELIYPSQLDETVPFILCHHWHSFGAIAVLLELYLVHHRFPSYRLATTVILNFWAAYALWVSYIIYMNDFWVSPVLEAVSSYALLAVFVGTSAALVAFYFFGEWLSSLFWGGKKDKKLFSCC